MTLAAIELDDAAVALARDGILLVKSPGVALPEGDTLLVGDDARRQARLKPRMVNSLFWERLSNQAVVPGNPRGESYADLARAHMARVWSSAGAGVDGLILVLPAHFDRQGMGLLLGIAEQLALPVRGMVDAALVACSQRADASLVVHVGIHLHRTVVTGIAIGGTARRVFAHSVESHGLVQLYDSFIKMIADLFVQTTRFDPLHDADSEQAIYDRLPAWLATLVSRDTLGIEMAARDGDTHVIHLTRSRVEKCAREFYDGLRALTGHLCAGQPFALELGHAAARMPGLADAVLGAGGDRVSSLPPGAGALGALHRAGNIIGEDWRNTLTVSLPCDALAGSEPVKPVG